MWPEGPLLSSQKPATGLYSELGNSNPHRHTLLSKTHFETILSYMVYCYFLL
jgi:hypothetical protein